MQIGDTASLEGRVILITGAGRGLGRAYALEVARRGAAVIVNDVGAGLDGSASGETPADEVVSLIRAGGGAAIASGTDITGWDAAGDIVALAVAEFGRLDVVVNSAGILRDRTLANMTAAEWDAVLAVHLRGPAALAHHAMRYWRGRAAEGHPVDACFVQTTAASALVGAFGQANYAAAKFGVVGLANVVATEGEKIGVRAVTISPIATTRMTAASQVTMDDSVAQPRAEQVAAVVAWLAEAGCAVNRQILHIVGDRCLVLDPAGLHAEIHSPSGEWTRPELTEGLTASALARTPQFSDYFGDLLPA